MRGTTQTVGGRLPRKTPNDQASCRRLVVISPIRRQRLYLLQHKCEKSWNKNKETSESGDFGWSGNQSGEKISCCLEVFALGSLSTGGAPWLEPKVCVNQDLHLSRLIEVLGTSKVAQRQCWSRDEYWSIKVFHLGMWDILDFKILQDAACGTCGELVEHGNLGGLVHINQSVRGRRWLHAS